MHHGKRNDDGIQTDHDSIWIMDWIELQQLKAIKAPGEYVLKNVNVIVRPPPDHNRK